MDIQVINNQVYLIDNLKHMRELPDNHYDLAIVDPPYGIGEDWNKDKRSQHYGKKTTYSNNATPDAEYFKELFRISKDQIIWGWNYYIKYLEPTNYIIIWDKVRNVDKTFRSEAEQAWTSKKIPMRFYRHQWDGCKKGKGETGKKSIHPHQKPVALYKWLLKVYSKPGDKIFDSHVGSGSIRIACHDMGFDFTGCEIDYTHWESQDKRFKDYIKQGDLFSGSELSKYIYN